jgi:hypothetical protein
MKEFIDQCYQQMEDDLSLFAEIGDATIKKLSGGINCVQGYLGQLKNYIKQHPFADEAEEITFFKYNKPRFYCQLIYLVEEFGIRQNLPPGSVQMQRSYYVQELEYLGRTFSHHRSLYQYYLDRETHHDRDYFLRSNLEHLQAGNESILPDPDFSTNQDYLFARFRAAHLLQDFLIAQITALENCSTEYLAGQISGKPPRRWTGDKINLIELAYGIYLTGQMNDGKAEIREIISWLEISLNTDLSQVYRMFLDIRRRKSMSYTKFLDKMVAAVHQHIGETNNYKPKKNF